MNKRFLLILVFGLISLQIFAQKYTPDEIITFKDTPQRELTLHVFYPNDQKEGENRPVVVSFFGGGWAVGNPDQFYQQSEFYASIGMVAISAEYRTIKRDKTTPFECVKDGKSAIRWVRAHSDELGINPDQIIASGGSAGGHIAACTALIEGYNEMGENLSVSSVPNAMVLFNPVLNTTKEGYGANKLVGKETLISPFHHIRPNMPPTLVFHGTYDTTVPYQNSVDFTDFMVANGNDCRLISAFGENHGFFNGTFLRPTNANRNIDRCMFETTRFLAGLGFVDKKLIPKKEPIRIACLGNSITFGSKIENRETESYPAVLQTLVGKDYEVKNFGRSGATLLSKGNIPYIKTDEFKALQEYAPDVVIIKLGTNDSKAINWKYKDEFEADYLALIDTLRANKVRNPAIFISTPTPSFTDIKSENINGFIIKNYIYPMVQNVAKKRRIKLIDNYAFFEDKQELFPDKVHPNNIGAGRLALNIYEEIAQKEKAFISNDISDIESLEGVLPASAYHTLRGGLKNCQKIFNSTKKGTVAFLGGSITYNPGWRDMVCDYLKRKFPETQFTFIAAGVPSEGSTSGAMRIEDDVLAKGKVDLLFEEAAVNDRSPALRCDSNARIRGMEGIIRRARANNPKMDIVLMYFVDPEKINDYNNGDIPQEIKDFNLVANYYDVSTINLAREVTDRINAKEFTWDDDFINLHPSPFGQKIYYRSMHNFLETAFEKSAHIKTPMDYPTLDRLDPYCYDNGGYVSIEKAQKGEGWSIDPSWEPKQRVIVKKGFTKVPYLVAEDESGYLTFKFKGRAVGIIALSGADAGAIEYTIDGKEYDTYDLFTPNSSFQHLPRYFMLGTELSDRKTHTLKIKLADKSAVNKDSKGNACRIYSFLVNR